jgi:hypothetical protein
MKMNNDLIADKIEEVIGRMFSNFRSIEGGPTEYSMFYDSNKHASWFIVIYFVDSSKLRDAIKQGVCYQVYSYLLNEFNNDLEISKIDKSISFEYGNRPVEKIDIENALRQLIAKLKSQQKSAGKTDIKICATCGHGFNEHQLLCNLTDDKVTPTEGWIMCPEENCNCFQTWGANYKMENAKNTSKFRQLFKNIFK